MQSCFQTAPRTCARRGEARRGDDATRVTMMALMATRGEREGFDVMHAREVHARDGMNGC